jgi:hypothetical protein
MMEKLGIDTVEKNVPLENCSRPMFHPTGQGRDCLDEWSYWVCNCRFKSFRPSSETLWKNGKGGGRSGRLNEPLCTETAA